jgi:hypothetical protein
MNQAPELFTREQRDALITRYVEKTGNVGEFEAKSNGFDWDSEYISDQTFSLICKRFGIELPQTEL